MKDGACHVKHEYIQLRKINYMKKLRKSVWLDQNGVERVVRPSGHLKDFVPSVK